jgi:cytidylate kinase
VTKGSSQNTSPDDPGPSVPVIAIDGPSGSGKGTVAQILAQRLGWHYLDSGAIYRVLALAAGQAGVDLADAPALVGLADRLAVTFEPVPGDVARVYLGDRDVSAAVRTEECGAAASRLAALGEVRAALLGLQHRQRRAPGLVADGRDMGTVVFPDARAKIFLTASPEIRAQRRYNQLKQKGLDVNLPRLIQEIRARDQRDAERTAAPMRAAADAYLLDSSALTIEQVVAQIMVWLDDGSNDSGLRVRPH